MRARNRLAALATAMRSPLGRLVSVSLVGGVLAFLVLGETPASRKSGAVVLREWTLPALPTSDRSALESVWRSGVWSTQAGAAAGAIAEQLSVPRITLLGVIRRDGRLEALIATDDGQRHRHVAGDMIPGGGRLLRVDPTEIAWVGSAGQETVVRLLSAPGAASAEAGPPQSR